MDIQWNGVASEIWGCFANNLCLKVSSEKKARKTQLSLCWLISHQNVGTKLGDYSVEHDIVFKECFDTNISYMYSGLSGASNKNLLNSFEARAGLQVLSSLVSKALCCLPPPPIHEGSFCALGAISRPTFYRSTYIKINYWPWLPI